MFAFILPSKFYLLPLGLVTHSMNFWVILKIVLEGSFTDMVLLIVLFVIHILLFMSQLAYRKLYCIHISATAVVTLFSFLNQILKKICDHPLLLTKRAAEGVLEGMDEMLNDQDKGMVERMAMNLADMANDDDTLHVGEEVSCKLTFIMSLLVSLLSCMQICVVTVVFFFSCLDSNN